MSIYYYLEHRIWHDVNVLAALLIRGLPNWYPQVSLQGSISQLPEDLLY